MSISEAQDRPASDPLCRAASGAALSTSNWRNRTWKTITTASHSPAGLIPKSLRHTATSLAIDSGADVLMVQQMLGHADAKETLNTYAKLFPDCQDEVTERMSKARGKALKKANPDRS
jgi:integrase